MHVLSPWLLLFFTLVCSWPIAAQTDQVRQQARLGNPEAQFQLAVSYQQAQQSDQAYYWFLQAAERDYQPAMTPLANAYLQGLGTPTDVTQALLWYTKSATLGDVEAALAMGRLYQQGEYLPQSLLMAEIWYHSIADRHPLGEQRYSELLQQRFNQRRANQLIALQNLEIQAQQDGLRNEDEDKALQERQTQDHTMSLMSDFLFVLIGLLLIMGILSLYRSIKNKQQHQAEQLNMEQKEQIQQQAAIIKQQKRQLDKLYQEFKKQQHQQAHHQHDQTFSLACALLGFHPHRLPDEKIIKQRYKQLSKIYHPDLQGSEEEMKRLNGAMKIINQRLTKR
ncbi:J domain-containing protein [Vibrio metschnikovii]|uniref:J domain-containing protein n=1 Tax=Vibrio metschnikovii TaxID=28172 RepID=UPI001C3021E6|nr:J domain-containing protein [Vibrio metschnikovii]